MSLLLIWVSLLAFYLAWNLGANDVANSMGTAVGSKALTLTQALAIAAILEFSGALLFGQSVSSTLATQIIDPQRFTPHPQTFTTGMIAVVIACGIWLNIATVLGLPVSSSHAVVGAIAGFAWIASGVEGVAWRSLGFISLSWVLTPVVSGAIAAVVYALVKYGLLEQEILEQEIPEQEIPEREIPDLESRFVPLQILSAAAVAFAHGSNDVGNAIAPLAAILYTDATGTIPTGGFTTPLWVLAIGALGIVGGLAVWGKKVIATVGEGIIPLQPSVGFCAQLGTAIAVLLASKLGFPVSTSHAIVGSVVGIGLVQQVEIRWQTLQGIALAWVITIPAAAVLTALIFIAMRFWLSL
jgi:inorganic phosphate transporter, PiT family